MNFPESSISSSFILDCKSNVSLDREQLKRRNGIHQSENTFQLLGLTNSLTSVHYNFAGVAPSSIAVQSPYMAQVQLLCDRIEEIPGAEGVQVASVDSFQGREADAVVISMVVFLTTTKH